MADFASMLYNTGSQVAQSQGAGLPGAVHEGAQLAQHAEELDTQQKALQQKQAELRTTQLGKLYDYLGAAQKYDNAGARNNYLTSGIGFRNALGLSQQDLPDNVIKGMGADENLGRLATLQAGLRSGEYTMNSYNKIVNDPQAFGAVVPTPLDAIKYSSVDADKAAADFVKGQEQLRSAQSRSGAINERTNQSVHQQALNSISPNKGPIKDLLTSQQNLNNAVTNFQKGGATANEFHELQGAVMSNLGIKGTTSAAERAKRLSDSTGIRESEWYQFLTGDTGHVASVLKTSPKLAAQVVGIANLEMQNKKKQAEGLIETNALGHQSFYAARPDLAKDFEATKQAALKQFEQPTMTTSGNDPVAGVRTALMHHSVADVKAHLLQQGKSAADVDKLIKQAQGNTKSAGK